MSCRPAWRAAVIAAALLPALVMAQLPTPIATAPAQAVAIPSPLVPLPGSTHLVGGVPYADHSFEGPTDTAGVLLAGNAIHDPGAPGAAPYPPAGGWTWTGARIAGRFSPLASANPAPHGNFVLALEAGTTPASVAIPFNLPASAAAVPHWRFSFLAAQRLVGTVADQQRVKVEVTIGSVTTMVYNDVIRDSEYRVHVTRPFAAP